MTMRAIWKGVVLAESDDTVVEGNHYPARATKRCIRPGDPYEEVTGRSSPVG